MLLRDWRHGLTATQAWFVFVAAVALGALFSVWTYRLKRQYISDHRRGVYVFKLLASRPTAS